MIRRRITIGNVICLSRYVFGGMHNGSEHDDHRLLSYEYIDKAYDSVLNGGLFVGEDFAADALEYIEKFLLHYNWLAEEAKHSHGQSHSYVV